MTDSLFRRSSLPFCVLPLCSVGFLIVSVGCQPANQTTDVGVTVASHDHVATDQGGTHEHGDHGHDDHAHDDRAHDDHAHEDHDEENSVQLSPQAAANLGLRVEGVSVGTFVEYIDVPGVVSDWPGRTHVDVTSPLTGVISAIQVARGEMIKDNTALFTLRLTHQDLVNTQERFLSQLGQLDVEDREISRLSSIASSGAVAGKTLITRKYERDRLMAEVLAARQSMLLHGLDEQQIKRIEQTRQLVREVTVAAPALHFDRSLHHDAVPHIHEETAPAAEHVHPHPKTQAWDNRKVTNARLASVAQPVPSHPAHMDLEFLVTALDVNLGQSVEAGDRLARLSDYSDVLIEGQAFQRDAGALRYAADNRLPLQAVIRTSSTSRKVIDGLQISYIGNEIGERSRALPFYVVLRNQVERSENRDGQRYVSWRYKPGQRLDLRVPTARFSKAIVVPKDAVAEAGLERYVFVSDGGHFDRVPVHVQAHDAFRVAIANDGQLKPGQQIAVVGAHQLLMELKNKSGGAVDPHHGHSH